MGEASSTWYMRFSRTCLWSLHREKSAVNMGYSSFIWLQQPGILNFREHTSILPSTVTLMQWCQIISNVHAVILDVCSLQLERLLLKKTQNKSVVGNFWVFWRGWLHLWTNWIISLPPLCRRFRICTKRLSSLKRVVARVDSCRSVSRFVFGSSSRKTCPHLKASSVAPVRLWTSAFQFG